MTFPIDALGGLKPNPEWAKLFIFDRKGWTRLPFGAFADSINERVEPVNAAEEIYVGLDDLDSGSLHILRWGKGSDVIGTKLRFRKGDIIFGRRRAYQRKLAVAEMDGICSAHAMVVRAKPNVLPEFLPFLMMSDKFMNRAVEISVGSLSPTINWKTLRREEFDLPPLDQQRRVAEVLWAMDEAIVAEEGLSVQVSDASKASVNSLITQGMTLDELQNRKGGKYPIVPLAKICERIMDGPHFPPKFSSQGIPYLLVSNFAAGEVDWNITKWISEETYNALTKRLKPEAGDVMYTVVGSYGVPVLVTWETPYYFSRHVGLLRPNKKLLAGRYLSYFLESELGKRQAHLAAVGNAQKTITLGALAGFRIPLPTVEEQDAICRQLLRFQQMQNSLTTTTTSLHSILNTFLNEVLT